MKSLVSKNLVLVVILSLFFGVLSFQEAKACEIEFEIIENEQEEYEVGDVLTLKVVVTLTHRSCPIAMKNTKFNLTGLKLVTAEDWVQISTMVWERTIKVEVVGKSKGKLIISAVRECDKDGGYGVLELECKSEK